DIDGPDAAFTAFAVHEQSSSVAVGYADGTVRLGTLGFDTGFVNGADAPASVRGLEVGATGADGALLYERVSEGQFRTQRFSVSLEDPAPLAPGRSIGQLDLSIRPNGPILA